MPFICPGSGKDQAALVSKKNAIPARRWHSSDLGKALLLSFLDQLLHLRIGHHVGGHLALEHHDADDGHRPSDHRAAQTEGAGLHPAPDEGKQGADDAQDAEANPRVLEQGDEDLDPADQADEGKKGEEAHGDSGGSERSSLFRIHEWMVFDVVGWLPGESQASEKGRTDQELRGDTKIQAVAASQNMQKEAGSPLAAGSVVQKRPRRP